MEGLGKGKRVQWGWEIGSCWNGLGKRDNGRMGKRIGIDMKSEYPRNLSERRKMNRIENGTSSML